MGKIYTIDEIKNMIENNGYEVIGNIIDMKTKVECLNSDGYRVMINPGGLKNRGDKPDIVSIHNPFSIDNIKQWIQNNNFTCKLISSVYKNSKEKLEWECECGNHYFASWADVRSDYKRYCNYCAKSKRYDGLVDYNEMVYEECLKRNYELLPNQNIVRSNTRFKYICKKHRDYGIQESFPNNFITSYGNGGCYACCIEKRRMNKRKEESFFKDITEKAGLIYIRTEYTSDDRTRIIYRCKKHYDKGEFSTYITNMKNNKGGCPCCNGQYRTKEDLQNELNELQLHVEILEYKDYASPCKCRCLICNNIWNSQGVYLTQGHTCPNCSKSKFELSVENILQKFNLSYISQYRFENCKDIVSLPFDFYLNDNNIAIEVDGEGHYMPIPYSSSWSESELKKNFEKIQYHDKIKTDFCNSNNIPLIRIPYWERDNLEIFLKNKFYENGVVI